MFLVAAIIDVAIASTVVLLLLCPPLRAMLVEACVLEHRARFWLRVSVAELIAGTALCTSTSLALVGFTSPLRAAAAVVRGGFAGLLLSLAAITAGTLAVGRAGAGTSGPGAG
jgi:hypothetical protein